MGECPRTYLIIRGPRAACRLGYHKGDRFPSEANIEPRLLTAFKRIRKGARNGLAVVYVQRGACGGCFNKIPPQKQLDIKLRKKIIVCEYCGRIMIDPDLAGVED